MNDTDGADKVPADYLACRNLAHAWRYTTVDRLGTKFLQGLECSRCRTRKYVTLSRFGEVEKVRYQYPADYQVPGSDLTSTRGRSALRLRALTEWRNQ